MVAKLAALGARVTWEQVAAIAGDSVVGRPHIARAMAAAGVISDPAGAFTAEWIGDGGRAYEDKYALDPSVAIGLVRDAGGVSVLAHPGTPGYEVPDEVIARLAAAGLAGVEVWHPDQPAADGGRARALAGELGPGRDGGQRDHGALTGYRIGSRDHPAGGLGAPGRPGILNAAQRSPQHDPPVLVRQPRALAGPRAPADIVSVAA